MAIFNPDVPDQPIPNYSGYSRSYEGASPAAALIKGVGDVIEGGLKGADTVVKSIIDQGIRQDVDAVRGDFTAKLEDAAGVPSHMRVGTPLDILPTADTSQPPPEVGAGLDRSAGVIAAGAKARPLLNTYYTAQLDKISKDYRSRFPGYVDYIDRKFESYTGQNPANKIISDLIGVIQSGSDEGKSNLEKARVFLEARAGQEGVLNGESITAHQMMALINSGRIADPLTAVMTWASKNDSLKFKQKEIQDNATTLDASNKINTDTAAKAMTDLSVLESSKVWNNVLGKIPGMSVGELNAFIDRAQRGEELGLDEKQYDVLASALDAEIRQARMDLRTRAQIRDKDGNSLFKVIGGDVDKYIDAGLKNITDLRDAIRSKDAGLIGRTARFNTAILNQSRYDLLSDPKLGSKFIALDAVQHFGGAQVAGILATEQLRGRFANDMFNYFDQQRSKMLVPAPSGEKQYTIKDAITDAKSKSIGEVLAPTDPRHRKNAEQEREYYDKMLKFPGKVLNDSKIAIPAKVQIARATFTQESLGLIGEFEKGANRTKAWSYLTDKDSVVTPLKKLSTYDPYVWQDAKSWADQEFRRFLFTDEINNLAKYGDTPTIGIGYRPGDKSRAPEFYAYEKMPVGGSEDQFSAAAARTRAGVSNTYLRQVNESLQRLNAGIRGVSNYIQADNGDANVYVLKTMIDAGFDPNKSVGIPGEIMKAMTAPAAEVDPFKTKNKKKDQSKPYE